MRLFQCALSTDRKKLCNIIERTGLAFLRVSTMSAHKHWTRHSSRISQLHSHTLFYVRYVKYYLIWKKKTVLRAFSTASMNQTERAHASSCSFVHNRPLPPTPHCHGSQQQLLFHTRLLAQICTCYSSYTDSAAEQLRPVLLHERYGASQLVIHKRETVPCDIPQRTCYEPVSFKPSQRSA